MSPSRSLVLPFPNPANGKRPMTVDRARQIALVVTGAVLALCLTAPKAGNAAETATPLTKQVIAIPGLPNALCNDGSPPVFYFRPGHAEDRDKWLIVFQDGGACASDMACTTRGRGNRYFLSSTAADVGPTFSADGILSQQPTINPDFAGFNHVFLHYCSSDAYSGDIARTIDGAPWQFRGKVIVEALIEQLATQPIDGGPTLATATEVLVAGSSTGGLGVHNNLDRIAARLPATKVKGLVDGAWIPPGTIPFDFGTFATRPDQPAGLAYWGARPDDSCVAANPQRPAACLSQAFALPYIATPIFVYADQRDVNILAQLGIARSPTSADEGDYVLGFAAAVRESLRASAPAFFGANVTIHNVLLWGPFYRITTDADTFGDTLHRWYFGEPGNIKVAAPPPGSAPLSLTR
jgi:hypothetical protein